MAARLSAFLAILLGLTALGLVALWVGNHGTWPTYAAISHAWEEQYQAPRDTGLLVVANGFFLFADQRRGAPAPTLFVPYWLLISLCAIWPVWYARWQWRERVRRRQEPRDVLSPNRWAILRDRLGRITVHLSAAAVLFILCLWCWTSTIDNLRLSVWEPMDLIVNIQRGRMDWQRTYALKDEIPAVEYYATPIPPQRCIPRVQTVLGFGYSSGHEKGYANDEPGSDPERQMVRLADYWILVIPLWAILLLVGMPFMTWLIGHYRQSHPSFGFRVIADDVQAT